MMQLQIFDGKFGAWANLADSAEADLLKLSREEFVARHIVPAAMAALQRIEVQSQQSSKK